MQSFKTEARIIAARNLTPNVASVAVSLDERAGHVHVTYYLYNSNTEDDEEWRELTVGELIAAFPVIRSATSLFRPMADLKMHSDIVFNRE
ncbi:hypothetical protein [Sphingobium scionense]|uniref:Uncharacterized protein n=1 Tax=Sphingobium scionense TaxID=1404341 RepID=A0A7W6PW96_9SPHN|nr:hypothetical protein [Sphingobium scionense]MBB4150280.1 hypothetical protein [Sphingobium scionense]